MAGSKKFIIYCFFALICCIIDPIPFEEGDWMKSFKKYIKNSLIALVCLVCAFALSLLFQYIFDVQEHITTVFVFAVFLASYLPDLIILDLGLPDID